MYHKCNCLLRLLKAFKEKEVDITAGPVEDALRAKFFQTKICLCVAFFFFVFVSGLWPTGVNTALRAPRAHARPAARGAARETTFATRALNRPVRVINLGSAEDGHLGGWMGACWTSAAWQHGAG